MQQSKPGQTCKLDVAVVIVTYKSAHLSIDCLKSIEAERVLSGFRVRAIVVDNNSGDLSAIAPTVEINDWSSWVTLVAAPKNGGFAYGSNVGIERAYADGTPNYVYLLNPDTQLRSGAIGELVRFLEAHAEVGIAGGSFENLDGSAWPIAFRFPSIFSELDGGLQLGIATRVLRRWVVSRRMTQISQPVDWISGASMMIRPAVIARIGGLDENYFLYFEETDFCRRAKVAGFSTWYVPKSRVMHIVGQSTNITDHTPSRRRLPAYWFESRRRYFATTFGISHAAAIDIVAIFAHSFGFLKRFAVRRTRFGVPHFIRDLIKYSVLWPHNRSIPAARCYLQHR